MKTPSSDKNSTEEFSDSILDRLEIHSPPSNYLNQSSVRRPSSTSFSTVENTDRMIFSEYPHRSSQYSSPLRFYFSVFTIVSLIHFFSGTGISSCHSPLEPPATHASAEDYYSYPSSTEVAVPPTDIRERQRKFVYAEIDRYREMCSFDSEGQDDHRKF